MAMKKNLQGLSKVKNKNKKTTIIWRNRASIRTRHGRDAGIRLGIWDNYNATWEAPCISKEHAKTNGQCKQRDGNSKKKIKKKC